MTGSREIPASTPSWMLTLARHRPKLGIALLIAAALLAIIPIWMVSKHRMDYLAVSGWGTILALVALGSGLWMLLSESDEAGSVNDVRTLVLLLGGLAGVTTWALSLILAAYYWRDTLMGGLDEWQGENGWRVWVIVLANLGGLALGFVSLLPARAVQRTDPAQRRLLYGYNAALTGILVLQILIVVNTLVYNYSAFADWTEGGIYSLGDRSKNVLKGIDRHVQFHVILPEDTMTGEERRDSELIRREMATLLRSFREINPKIDSRFLSPDLQAAEVQLLAQRYNFLDERAGVLILYGDEEGAYQFVKLTEIFAPDMSARGQFVFRGEQALISALSFLQDEKSKPVVYFTQGNGELDLNDTASVQPGQGAGELRELLQKDNYDVRGLRFSRLPEDKGQDPLLTVSNRVPDDASMVVVAGSRQPLPDFALTALREYMNPADAAKKKGKLVVLQGISLGLDGRLVRTGLEDLVAAFDVHITNDRMLMLPNQLSRNPLDVLVTASPRSRNPVAAMLAPDGRQRFLPLADVRVVQPRPREGGPAAGPYNAEMLLFAPPELSVWREPDLVAPPSQIIDALAKNDNRDELRKKLSQEPLAAAVAVAEQGAPSNPNDPHAFMMRDQKPRLLVFGTAHFVSNRNMSSRSRPVYYALFSSCLAWLREKPSLIGELEPQKRRIFALEEKPGAIWRLYLLPGVVITLGLVGLGAGVWLVRRR